MILRYLLSHVLGSEQSLQSEAHSAESRKAVVDLITNDLDFLVPLIRKFPKCYWLWKYRIWLLEESSRLLPKIQARSFWEQELALASKMLSLDSRNFLGWNYRRTVVGSLESATLQTNGSSRTMNEQEFDYTTKMINSNLSNFSAWHNRSKLIPKLLDERNADNESRRRFLDEGEDDELKF